MSRWLLVGSLVLSLGACKGPKNQDRSPGDKEVASEPAPAPAPPPLAEPAPAMTAAELYASCRERLEMPEAPAECKVDADCGTAGCGKEVCTTAKGAADMNTTCEDKPCFKVVEACGCHDGTCTWNVKSAAPPMPALPPSLPPTGPAPATPPGSPPPSPAPPTP